MMIINHDMNSIIAYNRANAIGKTKVNAMQKLSSGLRINSAADNAAGFCISEEMKGQIRGLEQAERNIQDGKFHLFKQQKLDLVQFKIQIL